MNKIKVSWGGVGVVILGNCFFFLLKGVNVFRIVFFVIFGF